MKQLDQLDGVSRQDKEMIQQIDHMMGAESSKLGVIKSMYWGLVRDDLLFPYPHVGQEEEKECQLILDELDTYMKHEHPRIQIDEEQEIPIWVVQRLFELGIMGLTIPKEYGGRELGITSYNKVLECIGRYCASTSVLVSAHQSIGCKAIMLFGTPSQKKQWLPRLATRTVSAFCLSEPTVGCDAAGQQTHYEVIEEEQCYRLNGEKKWSTSGAFSGLLTVVAKNQDNPKDISAFICTPDIDGVTVFENNRSKCGIRGTWQARIRFENVKIPKENLIDKEGNGLKIALTCLNFGRCTLSAGVLGAAKKCASQATKWSLTRYQFKRPLADFELVKEKVARMHALNFGMEAMLYMVTGLLDKKEKDVMVETAACKLFCSEMAWQVINDALQVMGGEGYMTENEVERAFRDSRVYLIVEGSNDIMYPFIFSYGSKQLLNHLLDLKLAFFWNKKESLFQNVSRIIRHAFNLKLVGSGIKVGLEVFLLLKPARATLTAHYHPSLKKHVLYYLKQVQHLTCLTKKTVFKYQESLIHRQIIQRHVAMISVWLFAYGNVLSKLNQLYTKKKPSKKALESGHYFLDIATCDIRNHYHHLNNDMTQSMNVAADAALQESKTMSNKDFIVPEASPIAKGTGYSPSKNFIKQFIKKNQKSKQQHDI